MELISCLLANPIGTAVGQLIPPFMDTPQSSVRV
jgi:hypothetical protein